MDKPVSRKALATQDHRVLGDKKVIYFHFHKLLEGTARYAAYF